MNSQKTAREVRSPSSMRRTETGVVSAYVRHPSGITPRIETSDGGCDHSGCNTGKTSRLESSHGGCGHGGCADGKASRLESSHGGCGHGGCADGTTARLE